MNWMISGLTGVPPILQSQSGRSARAISDTRSSASLWKKMCGMTAGGRSFRARTVSLLQGPLATMDTAHAARRHVRACRPIVISRVRTAARSRRLRRQALGNVASCRAATVRFENFERKPAADFFARALQSFCNNVCRLLPDRRLCRRPHLVRVFKPSHFVPSQLTIFGKQKREQPTRLRHRPIRVIGVDARKHRDPASKAAHRGGIAGGRERCFRRAWVEYKSLRFVSAWLVQILNVIQETGGRRSGGPWHRRRITGAAWRGSNIASADKGISAIGRKDLIGRNERHCRRT